MTNVRSRIRTRVPDGHLGTMRENHNRNYTPDTEKLLGQSSVSISLMTDFVKENDRVTCEYACNSKHTLIY
jgi:hypothetical protein